jgi:hypothetical protein
MVALYRLMKHTSPVLTSARAEVVARVAATLHMLRTNRAATRLQAIERTAAAARISFAVRAADAIDALRAGLAEHDENGAPPPVLQLAGRSTDEKPLNRFLGWLLDPNRSRSALTLLRSLADFLKFDEFARALAVEGAPIDVRCEQAWPSEGGSARQPDLLILVPAHAPRAVLLIENKVNSGEGIEQYASYIASLAQLAAHHGLAATERQAYLLAPEDRDTPLGWTGAITHQALSEFLLRVANEATMPEWDRVVCFLVGDAFAHGAGTGHQLEAARSVLAQVSSSAPRPRDIQRVVALLPLPKPFRWRNQK